MEQIILKYFKFFDYWKLFAENGYWKLFLLSFCSFRTMTSSTFHIDFWIEKQLTIVLNQKQLKNNSSSFLQFRKWRINLAQILIQIERMQAFYNCKYEESFCYCEAKKTGHKIWIKWNEKDFSYQGEALSVPTAF